MFRRTVGRHALMPPPVPGCVRREISRNRNCLTGGHKARPYIPTPGLLVGARIARPRRSASRESSRESQLPHGRIFNPPLQGAAEFPPRLKTAQKKLPYEGEPFYALFVS